MLPDLPTVAGEGAVSDMSLLEFAAGSAVAWERTALASLAARQAASHAARVSKRLLLPWQPPYGNTMHSSAVASQYLP